MNIQSLGCEADAGGCTYWFALSGEFSQVGRRIRGIRWDEGYSPYVVNLEGKVHSGPLCDVLLRETGVMGIVVDRDPVAEFKDEFNKGLDELIERLESPFKLEYAFRDGDREMTAKLLRRLRK